MRWLRAASAADEGGAWPPADGLDGALVVAAARGHRLSARAGARAHAAGTAGPAWIGELVRDWRAALGDEALFEQALGGLAETARRRGLPVIALKGSDLCRRVYAPGERPRNDLDLLVPAERLDEADAWLRAAGYQGAHPAPELARRFWFAATYRCAARPRLLVDLHWALGPPRRTRWDMAGVFRRAEPLPGVAGASRLDAADLAAHLAQHAVAFHGAAGRWLWWLDLHLVLRGADAGAIASRAREVGAEVALEAARLRAARLFGGVPGSARARARAIAALGRAFEGRGNATPGRWAVAALAVDRPRDLVAIGAGVVRRGASRAGRQRSQDVR
ncbi:MAG: nucleotidyltransferase family protein [Acidobacteria bacterium]|nr:nucleotidyltransferase family protein [Acidobacteriota bacterium]